MSNQESEKTFRNSGAQGETAVKPMENHTGEWEWTPMVDWSVVYPGNRGVNRKGLYDLYDAPVGIRMEVEEALKSEPLIVSEMEWEGGGQMNPVWIWKDGGKYRMLYRAYPATSDMSKSLGGRSDEKTPGGMGYAVSDDAYNWVRPVLNQVLFNNSRENNMIANAPTGTPFEDPLALPGERFKAIGQEGGCFDSVTGEQLTSLEAYRRMKAQEYEGPAYKGPGMVMKHWISGWTSPDCLNWKKIENPLVNVASDGGNAAQFDPDTRTYFAYIRVGGMGRRATGLTRTDDFWKWPPAKLVLSPDMQDDPDVSFYGSNYFRYPGCKDLHGIFVQIYHQVTDHIDNQIAFSRDGLYWHRPERKAVIPVGPSGSGEDCIVRSWGGLIELPDGYWATSYEGTSWLHNSRGVMPQRPGQIRWARWKPHRFCGIKAENEGHFTIPTVKRLRDELKLNYRCKPGGWISVELVNTIPSRLHPDTDGIPGFTFEESDRLTGDSLSGIVTWRGKRDISGVGDTIAVRIKMFEAKIFAFSC